LLQKFDLPIIVPNPTNSWEAWQTFNPGVILLDDKIHFLYRAIGTDGVSRLGYAFSNDGFSIEERLPYPVYEHRVNNTLGCSIYSLCSGGSFFGAEDPRLVKIGNKIYMFYTAYDSKNPPRVALTSIKVNDSLNQNWNWSRSVLISPPGIDDKDSAVFPEKIKGNYIIIHRVGKDIDLSFHKDLNFDGKTWLEEYRWLRPRPGSWDSEKVGLVGPPIKTKEGWIVFYHGFSFDKIYRVGAVLADLKDPTKIISRTDYPLFEPEEIYEKQGEVPNVVFPCSNVLIGDTIFFYYGGADKVIGVATVKLKDLLDALKICKI
jgi:predicted GH43/DUF377 family glycosyl hydrolase